MDVREIDEGMMLLGLRAAAWGSPYIPTRIGLGTDVITRNPDLQLVDSPYDDKEWVAMPALNLDVSLLHATRGDARGVCEIASPDHYMDDWFARAANKTVVSVDELVPSDYFHNADVARRVYWERNLTSHIVHIPGGAHPSSSDPLYGYDMKHYKEYAAALAEGGYDRWSEAYLGDSESSYQRNVGGLEAIQTLPLPVY